MEGRRTLLDLVVDEGWLRMEPARSTAERLDSTAESPYSTVMELGVSMGLSEGGPSTWWVLVTVMVSRGLRTGVGQEGGILKRILEAGVTSADRVFARDITLKINQSSSENTLA